MPSNRLNHERGFHRFSPVPPDNKTWHNKGSAQLAYEVALAKHNSKIKRKLAELEAKCKERKQQREQDYR